MSHFTVFAATRTPDESELDDIMLPYNEYECTGYTEYCQYISITQEAVQNWKEYNKKTPKNECMDLNEFLDYEYGIRKIYTEEPVVKPGKQYAVTQDGKIIAAYKFTNPNAKWDYYTIEGWFKKPYIKYIDEEDNYTILKKDFDIDLYMEECKKYITDTYRTVRDCIEPDFKIWAVCKNEIQDLDKAGEVYNAQKSLKNIREKLGDGEYFGLCFEGTIDEIASQTEEEFIKNRLDVTAPFWAIVIPEEGWIEHGRMGWWAITYDEDPDWKQTWRDAWDKIPDDYYLWKIDCHI